MTQDWLIIQVMKKNRWRRPVYFTNPPAWLKSFCRPEGLVYCLLPDESAATMVSVLRENLLLNYDMNGFADSTIFLNRFTRAAGREYFGAFLTLAQMTMAANDLPGACAIINQAKEKLPPERIDFSPEIISAVDKMCDKIK
jgi:hypothetical protein